MSELLNLQAENERMRRALRRIEDGYYEAAPPWAMAEAYPIKRLRRKQMMELARTALEGEVMSDFRTESVYEYEMRIARAEVDRLRRIEEAARALVSYGWWETNVKPYTKLLALERALREER